jgi:quercetin 2,3-dioxygenase
VVTATGSVLVRRSAERFETVGDGVRTRHLLSFAEHYDPALTSLGPLIAHNDEVVEPGAGYASHPHRGVEIVTWLVAGRLIHRESGGEAILGPGSAQVLSAGSGARHEELAGPTATSEPTRFVQMWLRSDDPDAGPRHTTARFDDYELRTRMVPIAAGEAALAGPGKQPALVLGVRGAVCLAGRMAAGATRALPAAGSTHVFVVNGDVSLAGQELDEVRLTAGDSALLADAADLACMALADAEVVVWAWNLDPTTLEPR